MKSILILMRLWQLEKCELSYKIDYIFLQTVLGIGQMLCSYQKDTITN